MKITKIKLIGSISKLFSWIPKKSKQKIYYLIVFSILISFLEVLSLMSIEPILNSINEQNFIQQNIINLSFINQSQYFLICGFGFVFLISLTAFIKIKTIAYGHYLSAFIGQELGKNLLKHFLGQEYEIRQNYSTAEIINTFSIHLTLAVKMLNFVLQFFVSFFCSLTLLVFVIYKSPFITLGTFISISIAYFLIAKKYKDRILYDSEIAKKALDKITSVIQEINNNIEKSILEYKDDWFVKRFNEYDLIQRMAGKRIRDYGTLPRYIIESVGIASFTFLSIIYFLVSGNSYSQILALLGTIIFGIQKLLPSINQIYNSWANMNSCIPSIYAVNNLLINKSNYRGTDKVDEINSSFQNSIEVCNVYFKYKNSSRYIFKNKSIQIQKGDKLLVRGKSGSGKSTLGQIISTLIKPQKGIIKIDGKIIGEEFSIVNWRMQIGYVKQKPKLYGEKIIDLILGDKLNSLSKKEALKKANKLAKIACINNFIETLPNKYYEEIKDDENFLSGGQIQRLALANALSNEPSFLILDESTAGIDKETEIEIIKNLFELKDLTLLLISHSNNLVKSFSKLINV